MAKKCAAGKIRRKAYRRSDGVKVKSACVPDKGRPGKGPQTLPKPKPGHLRGYSTKMSATGRRTLLNKLSKKEGCGKVVRKLSLDANLTKESNPKAHKVYRSDMAYLQKKSRVCQLQITQGKYHPSTKKR